MRHETRETLKTLANAIGDGLLEDLLKRKIVPKIGIDEIRAAITAKASELRLNEVELDLLEKMTTRRIVSRG
jgi:hypothetical protein